MNLYEWPTPNPAPKPTHHWGLEKGRMNLYELATSYNMNELRETALTCQMDHLMIILLWFCHFGNLTAFAFYSL